tara:strand:+ start:1418 stop:2077 length:660 start_codon:yes stop_codon:yes gene_type:complete
MRDYILEKTKDTTRHFRFGSVVVNQEEPAEDGVDFSPVFRAVEDKFPSHYFKGLKGVEIAHRDEFDDRNISALYSNDWLYLSDKQDKLVDLLDDLIHEMAHHLETEYVKEIYGDGEIQAEFLKKRKMLEAELRSEGYWTEEYDFTDIKYNKDLDVFLYDRVGGNMLKLATAGIFVRPYASVSLREYFATGFEAFYMGNKEILFKISPLLYNKIEKLHNL